MEKEVGAGVDRDSEVISKGWPDGGVFDRVVVSVSIHRRLLAR